MVSARTSSLRHNLRGFKASHTNVAADKGRNVSRLPLLRFCLYHAASPLYLITSFHPSSLQSHNHIPPLPSNLTTSFRPFSLQSHNFIPPLFPPVSQPHSTLSLQSPNLIPSSSLTSHNGRHGGRQSRRFCDVVSSSTNEDVKTE